jgi:hypothetical protein
MKRINQHLIPAREYVATVVQPDGFHYTVIIRGGSPSSAEAAKLAECPKGTRCWVMSEVYPR